MDMKKKVILLRNLLERIEYNEGQNHWKLVGVITSEEFQILQDVMGGLVKQAWEKGENENCKKGSI